MNAGLWSEFPFSDMGEQRGSLDGESRIRWETGFCKAVLAGSLEHPGKEVFSHM